MPDKETDQQINFSPNFFNVPAIVMLDPDLQPLDTKVYGIVYWLEQLKDGRCWASNATLAKFANSSPSGIAHSITRLREKKYIAAIYDENNQRKEIRTLVYYSVNPCSNEQGGVAQMSNIDNKIKKEYMSDLTEQQKAVIKKVYRIWLWYRVVDQRTREELRSTTDPDARKLALEEAERRYRLTPKREKAIRVRLDDAGYDMLVRAIKNLDLGGDFYRGDNDREWKADLAEFLCRSYERVETWANKNNEKEGN